MTTNTQNITITINSGAQYIANACKHAEKKTKNMYWSAPEVSPAASDEDKGSGRHIQGGRAGEYGAVDRRASRTRK